MAVIVPTMQISIDLTKPVEELEQVIMVVVNSYPGDRIEVLKKLQKSIDEGIKQLEQQKQSKPK